jgi:hypothetical protein
VQHNTAKSDVASLLSAREAAQAQLLAQQAQLQELNTALSAAQAQTNQANMRAASEAATAAQAADQLHRGAAEHQALRQEYDRGEGMFFGKQRELDAANAQIAALQQQLQHLRSPSPMVPIQGGTHPLSVFSPIATVPVPDHPLPPLLPDNVDTWGPYIRPTRLHILTNAIATYYGVNCTAPLNVRSAYDALQHLLELSCSNATPHSLLLKNVLDEARIRLRTEVARASGVHVERVADEMLRQDTKDEPFSNDERYRQEARADTAKARSKVKCRRCGQTGHLAATCRNKPSSSKPQGGPKGGPRQE